MPAGQEETSAGEWGHDLTLWISLEFVIPKNNLYKLMLLHLICFKKGVFLTFMRTLDFRRIRKRMLN